MIREVVKATGDIITVAGNGTRLQRRQRTRTAAELAHGVAVDAAGDLFIADTENNVIREVVKATGDIITVAGNGTRVTAATTDPRPPPSCHPPASPSTPRATCSSPTTQRVIREVVKATGDIITVAGNGTRVTAATTDPRPPPSWRPRGVAVDAAGDLFIADTYNNVIREVVKATGDIITVAGNGT